MNGNYQCHIAQSGCWSPFNVQRQRQPLVCACACSAVRQLHSINRKRWKNHWIRKITKNKIVAVVVAATRELQWQKWAQISATLASLDFASVKWKYWKSICYLWLNRSLILIDTCQLVQRPMKLAFSLSFLLLLSINKFTWHVSCLHRGHNSYAKNLWRKKKSSGINSIHSEMEQTTRLDNRHDSVSSPENKFASFCQKMQQTSSFRLLFLSQFHAKLFSIGTTIKLFSIKENSIQIGRFAYFAKIRLWNPKKNWLIMGGVQTKRCGRCRYFVVHRWIRKMQQLLIVLMIAMTARTSTFAKGSTVCYVKICLRANCEIVQT